MTPIKRKILKNKDMSSNLIERRTTIPELIVLHEIMGWAYIPEFCLDEFCAEFWPVIIKYNLFRSAICHEMYLIYEDCPFEADYVAEFLGFYQQSDSKIKDMVMNCTDVLLEDLVDANVLDIIALSCRKIDINCDNLCWMYYIDGDNELTTCVDENFKPTHPSALAVAILTSWRQAPAVCFEDDYEYAVDDFWRIIKQFNLYRLPLVHALWDIQDNDLLRNEIAEFIHLFKTTE